MKIAVYTICKNEAAFLDRWLDSCAEADYILVVDTGSTDNTVEKLAEARTRNANLHFSSVTINPWRFDEARNFSLHCLPDNIDVCICLDMDEVMTPNWREVIEANWHSGLDRLRYNYIWSWNEGKPAVTYHADKIHARFGMRWVNPVHEVLAKDMRLDPEVQKFINNTLIEHYPDVMKPRTQYFPLLELSVKERPQDDRGAHYYARELLFNNMYEKAIEEFTRHINMPTATWASERSASMRYMGDCYWALGDYKQAMHWFVLACEEAPGEREPFVAAAQACRALGDWSQCITYCEHALSITDRPNSYINQPAAWSDWPETMLKEARENEVNT